MKKFLKTLVLGLLTAALLCCTIPCAFAAGSTTEKEPEIYTIDLDAMGGSRMLPQPRLLLPLQLRLKARRSWIIWESLLWWVHCLVLLHWLLLCKPAIRNEIIFRPENSQWKGKSLCLL